MENFRYFFRKMAASIDATNFYLDHTTFGLFYFERKAPNNTQADKKLLHFLDLQNEEEKFNPFQFLDSSSKKEIKKLSKLKGTEINNQESFLLIWEVNGNQFQTTSYAYWLQSEDVVFIGLGETKKLFENSEGKYFNSRKQEEELRLFESVIKNTKDAILITEAEESVDLPGWKILFANSAFCEMTGYTLEELKGQTPKILQGEKTDRKVLDKVRKSLKNWEPCEYNLINYKKNGEEFWVNMSLTPIAGKKGSFTHWIAVERDISRQKEQEGLLRETKEKALQTSLELSNLFSAMEDAVFELDYNGTYIKAAPTAHKNRMAPITEVMGKTLHDYFPKEQADHFLNFVRQCLDENKSDRIEYSLAFNDQVIWFEGRGTPINKDRLLYIATNITDRKLAELELIESKAMLLKAKEKTEESEQRLKLAVDSAQLGIWEWNIIKDIFIWDTKTYQLYGYDKELGEITFNIWSGFLHEEDRDRVLKEVDDALKKNKEYNSTFRITQPNGKQLYLDEHGIILSNEEGDPIRMIGVVRDVTAEKNKQLELLKAEKDKAEESEKRLKLAARAAHIGIWDWDILNNTVFWDDKSFEIFGQQKNEELVTYESWYNSVHLDDRDEVVNELNEALKSKEELNTVYRIVHPDGSVKYVHSFCHFIRNLDDKAVRVIGVHHDVTESKRIEESLAKQSNIQAFLVELASDFINIPLAKVPNAVNNALANIGNLFNVDRAYIFQYDWQKGITNNTYEWCAEGISAEINNLQEIPLEAIPHWVETHNQGKTMLIPDTADDTVEEGVKEITLPQGIKSLITLPMMKWNNCIGFVGFDSVRQHRVYTKIEEELLLVFAQMLVNIEERTRIEEELFEKQYLFESAEKISNNGSWEWNLQTNEAFWSDGLYEIYGRNKQLGVPKIDEYQTNIYPEDWDKLQKAIDNAINRNEEYHIYYRIIRYDNQEVRILESKGEVFRDNNFNPLKFIGIAKDVTELKTAELELIKAKENAEKIALELSEAQKVAKLGSWYLDIATNKVSWSDELFNIYGYELGSKVPEYHEFEKIFTPESWARLTQNIQMAVEKGTSYEIELEFFRKDGVKSWMWAKGESVFDDDNKVIGVRGVSLDITERKKLDLELTYAKERAEESENRFKLATDAAQLGIWDWDLETNEILWDDRSYELYGLERGEAQLSVENLSKTVHPDDLQGGLEALEAVLNGKDLYDNVFRVIHPDGKELHIHAYGLVLRDAKGKPLRMTGTYRDVTEEKTAEIQLKQAKEKAEESEQRLKVATESAQLGVWEWYMDIDEVIWDDKSYELLGLKKGVDKSDFDTWSKTVHPDDLDKTVANLEAALRGETEYNPTFRAIHPDGKELYIKGNGIILKDSEGNPVRMIGVQRDITDEKVGEIKLKEAKEKAEAASVAKSEFLAVMSHEIRTPLNSVIGFSELLLQTELNNVQEDYIQSVNYSANTLLDLVNDILDFSKIEAGKLELELARIDLHTLLYQVIEMVKFKLQAKEIELLLHIASDVPRFVMADAVRIKQVVINLMGNAVKFTESGEIELSVIAVETSNKQKKTLLRFGVRDTGIGISEVKQKSIFEAFSQEDASITRKYGGTGLGLSISNKLLSLMESKLQLTSEQGKGSLFYFDINLECEQKLPIDEDFFEGLNSVLLIDDNARSLEIIESIFTGSNTKIETANNGFDGLVKLQDNWKNYDAVLLDYKMPLLSGEEVIKKTRDILPPQAQQLPIFMMFDILSKNDCSALKEKHAIIECLQKPITKKELVRGVSLLKNQVDETTVAKRILSEQVHITSFNRKPLLVVDDNPMNRKVVKSMFERLFTDIEIIEAENGEKALELVKNYNFDLVLMDIQMPGMSGYETTRHIRKIDSKLPIIALTAGTIKGERERCLAAGMEDYMSKPVTLSKLKAVLKKWTDNEEWEEHKNNQDLENSIKLDFNYKTFLKEFDNDVDTVEELIDIIREGSLKKEINKLNEIFTQDGKEKEICLVAHKIKGICLNLHFEKLAEIASQLEDLPPKYYGKEAKLLLRQINENYQTVIKIISDKEYL